METTIWQGKPFQFGLPSFTKYMITDSRIIVEKGVFTKRRDEIRLYRVRDIAVTRSLIKRIFRIGDITVYSTDTSSPQYVLRNIRQTANVADLLGEAAESARLKYKSFEITEV
jgi:uncharacterized membrane protein YdbT with pleckstrin-like domain